jgi:hypothetical protein
MLELNEQQQHALDEHGPPLTVVDPRTNAAYVLIRRDAFERMQDLVGETVYATGELVDRVMAEDDASDPHLAEYQHLYGKP